VKERWGEAGGEAWGEAPDVLDISMKGKANDKVILQSLRVDIKELISGRWGFVLWT
jgi:hypothetical protein